jgi:hypothetical protein
MNKKDEAAVVEDLLDGQWIEDIDAGLPEAVAEARKHGRFPDKFKHIKGRLGIRELPDGHELKFDALLTDTLIEVFERGAQALDKPLLPPGSAHPLDILRCREQQGNGWSDPITHLERPLWLALAEGCSRHFGIEYVLAVKINTKWDIAPSASATPRQLLTSFGFDPAQFSLYRPDSLDPLPPDTPLSIKRGETFEAQKDGRYGASTITTRPRRGSQSIEDDVEALKEAGYEARLFNYGGQKYVEVKGIATPSPPWSLTKVTILIAIPATYPAGGLDAFYIERTVTHANGSIPYQSQTAEIGGRSWALISWHYSNTRPWNPMQDDIATHIEHCRGALLRRGVTQ